MSDEMKPVAGESWGSDQRKIDSRLMDELYEIDDGLTHWELSFIESIGGQVAHEQGLSPKQRAIAEKILERFR